MFLRPAYPIQPFGEGRTGAKNRLRQRRPAEVVTSTMVANVEILSKQIAGWHCMRSSSVCIGKASAHKFILEKVSKTKRHPG